MVALRRWSERRAVLPRVRPVDEGSSGTLKHAGNENREGIVDVWDTDCYENLDQDLDEVVDSEAAPAHWMSPASSQRVVLHGRDVAPT